LPGRFGRFRKSIQVSFIGGDDQVLAGNGQTECATVDLGRPGDFTRFGINRCDVVSAAHQ
jgi:hypothetical protein